MGDDDDGAAIVAHALELNEKLLRFLGRQNRSRLIEDDQLRAPCQHLQNLHLLGHAHRQRSAKCIGIHGHVVLLRQRRRACTHCLFVQQGEAAGLHAQVYVLIHGKLVDEHEMLIDHADAQRSRGFRGRDQNPLPVPEDLPLRREFRTVEDLHQGGFSRSVFTRNGMDLPCMQAEIYLVIGKDSVAKPLGDPGHAQ